MGKPPPSDQSKAARLARDLLKAERNSIEYRDKHKPLDMGGIPGTKGEGRDKMAGKDGKRRKFIARFDDGRVETHWLACPPNKRRCTGKLRGGVYKGQRCRRPALRGARVCPSHGASLPAVKEAAKKRLLAATDIAVQGLLDMAFKGRPFDGKTGRKDADRIKALLAILDRAGLDGKQTILVEIAPWQEALKSIQAGLKGKAKKSKGKEAK